MVVRVTSCGLCGTDMHLLGGELPAAAYPLVPGHELTGEIVAVGAAVTGRAVGERVAVDPNMPCGACHYCRIGRGNLCEDYTAIGVTRGRRLRRAGRRPRTLLLRPARQPLGGRGGTRRAAVLCGARPGQAAAPLR